MSDSQLPGTVYYTVSTFKIRFGLTNLKTTESASSGEFKIWRKDSDDQTYSDLVKLEIPNNAIQGSLYFNTKTVNTFIDNFSLSIVCNAMIL